MTTRHTLPLLLLLITLFTVSVVPQENLPSGSEPEITQKDDRLPFMVDRDAESVASAEPGSATLILKSIGAMVLVLALIFFGAWGARKLEFGNARSVAGSDPIDLKILATVGTGGGRTIAAVSFAGRVLLVGSTANSFTLLAEESREVANTETRPRSVAELLLDEASFEDELKLALSASEPRI